MVARAGSGMTRAGASGPIAADAAERMKRAGRAGGAVALPIVEGKPLPGEFRRGTAQEVGGASEIDIEAMGSTGHAPARPKPEGERRKEMRPAGRVSNALLRAQARRALSSPDRGRA